MKPSSARVQIAIDWACEQLEAPANWAMVDSGDNSIVLELAYLDRRWFLKIARGLRDECDRLIWLKGRLPVPDIVAFRPSVSEDSLLMTALPGKSLAELCRTWDPAATTLKLAEAIRMVHATPVEDYPHGTGAAGYVLVHGDACLPNILFDENTGTLMGFIDVGEMRVDNPDVDLSAGVWSLQYNIGSGHGLSFLKNYGIDSADDEMLQRLWRIYRSRP